MEITLDSIIGILGLLFGGGALGGIFTWRWQRKKAKAEAQTEEVNMAKAVQDTYQEMLNCVKTATIIKRVMLKCATKWKS